MSNIQETFEIKAYPITPEEREELSYLTSESQWYNDSPETTRAQAKRFMGFELHTIKEEFLDLEEYTVGDMMKTIIRTGQPLFMVEFYNKTDAKTLRMALRPEVEIKLNIQESFIVPEEYVVPAGLIPSPIEIVRELVLSQK